MDTGSDPPPMHPFLRGLIAVVVATVAAFGAFVAWFGGVVTFTGCLVGCGDPNRPVGVAFFVLFTALVGVVFVAVDSLIRGWDRAAARQVFGVGVAGGIVLVFLSILAG